MQHTNPFWRNFRRLTVTAFASLSLMVGAQAVAEDDSKGTVHLAYVEWSSEVASTNVMRALLEEAGFDVKTSALSAAAMWQAVASGDADATLAAWLPTTHEEYYERLKDDIVDAGVNLDGTKLGLAVPTYVEIDSITELNDSADLFNNEIIGIDPGAGLQGLTEDVVEDYDLSLRLRDGSDATMTAALANAVNNDEPIVVTAWTPHWKFARWDMKYLDDPKGVYGGAEQIHTITRKGFAEDNPEAYAILERFEWTPVDMEEVMLLNEEAGSDPYENAKKWLADNEDRVKEWLGQ
ncbi:MAG TPA: glycine betaine ABC transporter substrate-binding protein [Paenalcaligenes sp.]|nr:glycine betaine ABC transporter substrate-binding protein [Paenalcaligenes sp.]